MEKHPLSDVMETTMQRIRDMIDVNTVIGKPIVTPDGITLIPVSKVSFGFGCAGSDFVGKNQSAGGANPFGGGSGAGVNIIPVAFLVVKDGNVKMVSVAPPAATTVDRIVEMVPDLIEKAQELFSKED
jgi:sporulation protein YtfJ